MRRVFQDSDHERRFREEGYVVVDLLDAAAVAALTACYEAAFRGRREVVPYARRLPYYISVFDADTRHRREVDAAIAARVAPAIAPLLCGYETFVSNFMIKFPGDGEIEAHQDLNFVDETRFAAMNLWCPLGEVELRHGGLCVVPGSHRVFRTQRAPTMPRALTEHNALLRRHARWVPVAPGQAVIFDHRLVHYSPPNTSDRVRVAVQSVLKPVEAQAVHYVCDAPTRRVRAHAIDRDFILDNDLWATNLDDRPVDHEQALIPFPEARSVRRALRGLALRAALRALTSPAAAVRGVAASPPGARAAPAREAAAKRPPRAVAAPLLADPALWQRLSAQGYVVVELLDEAAAARLAALYRECAPVDGVSDLWESSRHCGSAVNRRVNEHIREAVAAAGESLFGEARVYGGSFMVKSCRDSTMLPLHQDWSVVDEAEDRSLFVWCALDDIGARDGGLFVLPGSHRFFDGLRSGSYPSDRFHLTAAEHDRHVVDLELRRGQAVLYFDSLFHGSHANQGPADRVVATARLTNQGASLRYFQRAGPRTVADYVVDAGFYLGHIDRLARGELPPGLGRPSRRRRYQHRPVTEAALRAALREQAGAAAATPAADPAGEAAPAARLFRDARTQARFERDGFVVVDLLDAPQVQALRRFHAGLDHAECPPGGFQVSLDHADEAFVRGVTTTLIEAVRPRVDALFLDYQLFTASFVTKARSPLGIVPPHQDWTFVDETRWWSATIWCPLVDTSVDNGGLGLVRGSHRLYDHVRPSPSPQYRPPFADQLASLFPYLDVQRLRAGQAIVFDNRTLHGSPPNTDAATRLAFGVGITHREAQLRHYHLLPGTAARPRVEGFAITPDFFCRYNNARLAAMHARGERLADARSLGVFALEHRDIPTQTLVSRLEACGNRYDPELAERVGPALAAMMGQGSPGPADGPGEPAPAAGDARPATPFWKVYTPLNVYREIRYRLGGGRSRG